MLLLFVVFDAIVVVVVWRWSFHLVFIGYFVIKKRKNYLPKLCEDEIREMMVYSVIWIITVLFLLFQCLSEQRHKRIWVRLFLDVSRQCFYSPCSTYDKMFKISKQSNRIKSHLRSIRSSRELKLIKKFIFIYAAFLVKRNYNILQWLIVLVSQQCIWIILSIYVLYLFFAIHYSNRYHKFNFMEESILINRIKVNTFYNNVDMKIDGELCTIQRIRIISIFLLLYGLIVFLSRVCNTSKCLTIREIC